MTELIPPKKLTIHTSHGVRCSSVGFICLLSSDVRFKSKSKAGFNSGQLANCSILANIYNPSLARDKATIKRRTSRK